MTGQVYNTDMEWTASRRLDVILVGNILSYKQDDLVMKEHLTI